MADEHDARLMVLGQIAVMRERLDRLESELVRLPAGGQYLLEGVNDAIGNLSFQTGILIGTLSKYKDSVVQPRGRRDKTAPDVTQPPTKEGT